MEHTSKYVAKVPDKDGLIHYTADEDAVWQELYERQMPIVEHRACQEFLNGLEILNFRHDKVPQCKDVSAALNKATGWSVERVEALIPYSTFFSLLAQRKFPAATFIRHRDELDYLQEPDIFHEFFGHCPMLTDPVYANFMEQYGKLGVAANEFEQVMLARLYWFTVEFGLIKTKQGLRIYGGGILSSKEETVYATDSDIPLRKPFDPLEALRTPYRIDILQPIYFIIESYQELYDLIKVDLIDLIYKAKEFGEHKPMFEAKQNRHWC